MGHKIYFLGLGVAGSAFAAAIIKHLMQERVVKVILPVKEKAPGLELLDSEEGVFYWIEESNSTNVVISILTDSGQTESLMDKFERRFGKTEGFKLIVFPVEASIPRKKEEEKPEPESEVKTKQKKSARISREELYADIVGSTKMSNVYLVFVVLSTIVAAIGLMKDNVAIIIGAMVIAPFLGPSVALALSATLGENKLRNDALRDDCGILSCNFIISHYWLFLCCRSWHS